MTDTTGDQGGGGAEPSTTTFYLSTNTTLDAADVAVGSRAIAALAAGASSSGPASLTIPPTIAAGTYRVIAKADDAGAVGETYETNNTRTMVLRVSP